MRALAWSMALCGALIATGAAARVTRIEIESRLVQEEPAGGHAGRYEILRGRFYGELDPGDPHNRIITDLTLAPRNARGRVEYSATFALAKPVDMARASGVLLYEVPNRGGGGVQADPDGHVRLVSGWQGDLSPTPGRQTATVPVARNADGTPVTSPVFVRFVNMKAGTTTLPLVRSFGLPVPSPLPLSLDTGKARLFRQASDQAPQTEIPAGDWAFSDCAEAAFPGTPDPAKICLKGGFDPVYAYGLTYTGKDPAVLGIGFAATRDINSFFRLAQRDDDGTANPVAGAIKWTVGSGTSQSGNFVRSFIHLGFNSDEGGKIVFDGANANIAARHVPLNIRFGVPGGATDLYELGSEGTLWWAPYTDRARGQGKTSLLDRCQADRTCPKIFETFGSAEFWGLRMSPGLVGTDAVADIPLPANVRRYYFPGVTHNGGAGGFQGPDAGQPPPSCVLAANPNPSSDTMRALKAALIAWVTTGREPPASRYPRMASGDLVAPEAKAMGFPTIPNQPVPDGKINTLLDYDVGAGFSYRDVSGVPESQPPKIRRPLPSLVPRVDSDGNEMAGVASVNHMVPLGTYLGWNVMAAGYGKGGGCGFSGGFIPFAATRAERVARGDPRPSLEERYGSHEGFVARIDAAAKQRVTEGYLLQGDAERLVAEARASTVLLAP